MDRPRRAAALALLALLALLVAGPAWAITGKVVDVDEQPVEGARVCYMNGKVEERCVLTGKKGDFLMPDAQFDTLRVLSGDFLPRTLSVSAASAPIVLERTPILTVRLLDRSTGRAIGKGEIFVLYPSGREVGPFPVNAAGVSVRQVLTPGKIRLRAKAEGYEAIAAREATLGSGVETRIDLELTPVR